MKVTHEYPKVMNNKQLRTFHEIVKRIAEWHWCLGAMWETEICIVDGRATILEYSTDDEDDERIFLDGFSSSITRTTQNYSQAFMLSEVDTIIALEAVINKGSRDISDMAANSENVEYIDGADERIYASQLLGG